LHGESLETTNNLTDVSMSKLIRIVNISKPVVSHFGRVGFDRTILWDRTFGEHVLLAFHSHAPGPRRPTCSTRA